MQHVHPIHEARAEHTVNIILTSEPQPLQEGARDRPGRGAGPKGKTRRGHTVLPLHGPRPSLSATAMLGLWGAEGRERGQRGKRGGKFANHPAGVGLGEHNGEHSPQPSSPPPADVHLEATAIPALF